MCVCVVCLGYSFFFLVSYMYRKITISAKRRLWRLLSTATAITTTHHVRLSYTYHKTVLFDLSIFKLVKPFKSFKCGFSCFLFHLILSLLFCTFFRECLICICSHNLPPITKLINFGANKDFFQKNFYFNTVLFVAF